MECHDENMEVQSWEEHLISLVKPLGTLKPAVHQYDQQAVCVGMPITLITPKSYPLFSTVHHNGKQAWPGCCVNGSSQVDEGA